MAVSYCEVLSITKFKLYTENNENKKNAMFSKIDNDKLVERASPPKLDLEENVKQN